MFRGTTPTIKFDLPFQLDQIEKLYITIEQGRAPIMTFGLDRVEETKYPGIFAIKMTQEETLMLKSGIATRLQARIETKFGDAIASQDVPINVNRILKDGVI